MQMPGPGRNKKATDRRPQAEGRGFR